MVRDTKNRNSGMLVVPASAWRDFVAGGEVSAAR
jgi:uncharacterized protein DUF397